VNDQRQAPSFDGGVEKSVRAESAASPPALPPVTAQGTTPLMGMQ
jgi:hypothetical protein